MEVLIEGSSQAAEEFISANSVIPECRDQGSQSSCWQALTVGLDAYPTATLIIRDTYTVRHLLAHSIVSNPSMTRTAVPLSSTPSIPSPSSVVFTER